MIGQNGFLVRMMMRVYNRVNNVVLLAPTFYETVVHPPAWCCDDPAVLEMQLCVAARMKYLFEVRKQVEIHCPEVSVLANFEWSVRGTLIEYFDLTLEERDEHDRRD